VTARTIRTLEEPIMSISFKLVNLLNNKSMKKKKDINFTWNATIQELAKLRKPVISYCSCSLVMIIRNSKGKPRCSECGLLVKEKL